MSVASAMLPVQATVYALLVADVTLQSLKVPVLDAVFEGQSYPYVEVGELEETLDNVFTKRGRQVLVSLHIYSDQPGFQQAQTILEQLNVLLDDSLLPNPGGWTTIRNEYEIGSAQKEFDKVELRHVIARYRVWVEQ